MVRTMVKATGVSLPDLFRMASLTPAKRTGISADVGSLEAGKFADVLLFSDALELESVYLSGQCLDG